jgi:hypothetical protein
LLDWLSERRSSTVVEHKEERRSALLRREPTALAADDGELTRGEDRQAGIRRPVHSRREVV